jgi:ribosomal protein S18 acetylase RimI-like enzyme
MRGKGQGSALVSIGTKRADEDGVACYLETGSLANIDLYRSHGFQVVGQVDFQGFALTGMLRPPGGHLVVESENT